jgi:ribulose-phosphate 3-epimerase
MIREPERYLPDFAEAGADLLVVHAEATTHLDRTLSEIRRLGLRSGVALNPATPVGSLENVVELLDLVLIMSVNPGFSGQNFIPRSLVKVQETAALLKSRDSKALIQVDGGVDPAKAGELVAMGADVLVSGSSFFGHPPYNTRLADFNSAAGEYTRTTRSAMFGLSG